MPEEIKVEETKKEDSKKKGPLEKLKEKVEDSDEHLAILSTFVRLGILVWLLRQELRWPSRCQFY